MFKSYYVVWKLPIAIGIIRPMFAFKSYYVVWKLFRFRFISEKSAKFKSYYVVWKQKTLLITRSASNSLNRTM